MMLLDFKPQPLDAFTNKLFGILSQGNTLPGLMETADGYDVNESNIGSAFVEQMPGIYLIAHHNGGHMLPKGVFDDWPKNLSHGSYGVCDSVENLLEKIPELITSDRQFVVTLTRVTKANQPSSGGWRWHKWGEYIGHQDSQCEYIYDEPVIEEVFCYHIYEKVNVVPFNELVDGQYYATSGYNHFWDGVRWDATAGKFKTFAYDHENQDMVLKEYDYTSNWDCSSGHPLFAPTGKWTDAVRREVPLDSDPPLLENNG